MILLAANRRYEDKIDGVNSKFLVPYADMMNHKYPGSKTKWHYIERRGFFITATDDIAIGEEVCISYGKKNIAEWFMNYGFINQNSQGDDFLISLNINPNDSLF